MQKFLSLRTRMVALCLAVVAASFAVVVPMAGATSLGEAFNPTTTASTLLSELGPVGVAVVSIFVAVFLFTVGLHFFRRNGKSVAK